MGSGASTLNQQENKHKSGDNAEELDVSEENDELNFEQALQENYLMEGVNSPREDRHDGYPQAITTISNNENPLVETLASIAINNRRLYNQGVIISDTSTAANPLTKSFVSTHLAKKEKSNGFTRNNEETIQPPPSTPSSVNDPKRKRFVEKPSKAGGWVDGLSASDVKHSTSTISNVERYDAKPSDSAVSRVERYCTENIVPFSRSSSGKSL